MHQISFELKRGHLRTVSWGEKVLRGVPGMTAARFDLLCLVRQKAILRSSDPRDALTIPMSQRELWQRLDLDKSTVSKMLSRLEEMGWIRRGRARGIRDWRSKAVYLTDLGLRHIAKAMRIMFRQRPLVAYFERIYKARIPNKHVVRTLHATWKDLRFLAECFGDRSNIAYDFGPGLTYGPLDWDFFGREPYHPLYQPPPKPKLPPKRKGPRQPIRPFEFSDYENSLRAAIWGDDQRKRRPKKTAGLPLPRPRPTLPDLPMLRPRFARSLRDDRYIPCPDRTEIVLDENGRRVTRDR